MMEQLSIVIPCYNEEKRIEKTLKIIKDYCEHNISKYEIILVNDGSTDNTGILLDKYRNDKIKVLTFYGNCGKGAAVKKGIETSEYNYILFTDADNSTPIEQIEKLYPFIQNNDIVIGSREIDSSSVIVSQHIGRKFIGWCFRQLYYLLLGLKIKDTQCGFKLFRRENALKIFNEMKIERWAFDVEILYLYKKYKYSILEVGVTWYDDKFTHIRPIRDGIQMFCHLIKIRLIHG